MGVRSVVSRLLSCQSVQLAHLALTVGLVAVTATMLVLYPRSGPSSGGTVRSASPSAPVYSVDYPTLLADARPIVPGSFRFVARNVLPVVAEVHALTPVPRVTTAAGRQSPQTDATRRVVGSGVLVYRDKSVVYVLTNNHVVGEATVIRSRLTDGREFENELVWKDPRSDLAILSFETDDAVPVARLGNSSVLEPGDWVLAIGSPLGLNSTLTAGIVSAVGRHATRREGEMVSIDFIQTDAAINRGNSGGALVNMNGELVGINTWMASPSGGNVGLGFAIPIDTARAIIEGVLGPGPWSEISGREADERA
jgi:serine protease Do